MDKYYQLETTAWHEALAGLLGGFRVFAPMGDAKTLDYRRIREEDIPHIVYNTPRPVIPLKTFFLPVKENVATSPAETSPTIIMGVPACDLSALDLLDKFFIGDEYADPYYARRRENTILIGADCHSTATHCHCSSYGLNPYPDHHHDLSVNMMDDCIWVSVHSEKGETLLSHMLEGPLTKAMEEVPLELRHIRQRVRKELEKTNKRLPNYQETTDAVINADTSVWHSYSRKCVACGACATICPTCTCFLLVDRPGFEKVRQLDACQYPGFEKTAGGEDPLKRLDDRFRNRYLCKYLFRPEKYDAIACTGCGRCIDACIGKINKNEVLVELTK